jgi:hypothetical protein
MAGWFTRRTNAANNAHQGPVLFQMASKSKCMTGHTDPFSDGWGIHLTDRVQASFQIVVRSRAGFFELPWRSGVMHFGIAHFSD